eukprot:6205933-Pleurochrysis_carterae.AAC.1
MALRYMFLLSKCFPAVIFASSLRPTVVHHPLISEKNTDGPHQTIFALILGPAFEYTAGSVAKTWVVA